MRTLVALLLLVGGAPAVAAQTRSSLDAAIPGGFTIGDLRQSQCHVTAVVGALARDAGLLVGIEQPPGCRPGPWFESAAHPRLADDESVTVGTAREALDLVARFTGSEWRELDGVVVVRPAGAWNDPLNRLNLPTAPFTAHEMRVRDMLSLVLHRVTPSQFTPSYAPPHPGRLLVNRAVSATFPGGTLLEAFNAIVRAHGAAWWQLGHRGDAHTIGERQIEGPVAIVVVHTLECCPGELVMAPVGGSFPRQQRR
jgi:hypothetical protein